MSSIVEVGNDWFDLVAEQVLFALVSHELNAEDFAQVAHERRFIVDSGEAAELFLLVWERIIELNTRDLLDLVVNLARCDADERRRDEPMQTVG